MTNNHARRASDIPRQKFWSAWFTTMAIAVIPCWIWIEDQAAKYEAVWGTPLSLGGKIGGFLFGPAAIVIALACGIGSYAAHRARRNL